MGWGEGFTPHLESHAANVSESVELMRHTVGCVVEGVDESPDGLMVVRFRTSDGHPAWVALAGAFGASLVIGSGYYRHGGYRGQYGAYPRYFR